MPETLVAQAQLDLRKLAGELMPDEKIKSVIGRVAAVVGLKYSRTFELWYGRSRRLEDYEREQICEALAKKELKWLENELHNWRMALARMETKAAALRADMDRPRFDLLSHEVRGRGRRARPSNSALA